MILRIPSITVIDGYAHFQLPSFAQAAADFSEVIRLRPDDVSAYQWRGHGFHQLDDFSRAAADFTEAIARCPESAEGYLFRGDAHYRMADYSAALADATESQRLNQGDARTWNLLAWIEATCPVDRFRNGADAVEKARRACELAQPRDWNYVGTLAAAHVEAGRFDEAVRYAREVLSMAPAEKLAKCETPLAKYERREPHRDDPLIPKRTPRQ